MDSKHYFRASVFSLSLISAASGAADLRDPHTRDEDISATDIESSVTMSADGLYVYTYNVVASLQNTGRVLQLDLDVSCDEVPDAKGFSASDFQTSSFSSLSEDGRHVPVAVFVPYGQAGRGGVTQDNSVMWLLGLNPGESSTGLKVLSPYPPGNRDYTLTPSEDYNHAKYDYSAIDATDDDGSATELPWIDDWAVSGVTIGPACPGAEFPPGGAGDRFSGSMKGGENDQQNLLLTYSAPLRSQIHTDFGEKSVTMTIHYSDEIDPASFRVTPERRGLRSFFHPVPGGSETIDIPLDTGLNRIKLQVSSRSAALGRQAVSASETAKAQSFLLDQDVFVFRVPGDLGKGKPSK